ncbi:MAG: orotidine-5'-phosphate decarboxylase [Alphaproteobacteria bacterium]|nr:orotidine-5'-phosphate decarboxylase [Alphaproteobacteria bacterium]
MTPFADRLIEAVRRRRSPLCVGLDPFPDKIPSLFGDAATSVAAVEAFFAEVLTLAAPCAAVVKPQLGLFERYGAEGYAAAQRLCAMARDLGLLVLLDAKRGDIGTTAEGYAEAALGAPFAADAVTVNPYMGFDTIEPFVARAARSGAGVAVLVRTSNPGARDVQDLRVDGAPVWARVAEGLAPFAARLQGETGWSGLMAVAGATWPDEAKRLRALMPTALFLVPGYGAQGASAADAVAGFVRGADGRLEGGVVNASRSVLYPPAAAGAATLPAWRAAVTDALKAAAADLGHVTEP